jgi:hypothetical protein
MPVLRRNNTKSLEGFVKNRAKFMILNIFAAMRFIEIPNEIKAGPDELITAEDL